MTTNDWISPTLDDTCPECAQKVETCVGVELYAATLIDPADYGCLAEERAAVVNTNILTHQTAEGLICRVGEDNSQGGQCAQCWDAENSEPDYDEPDYDDYDAPGDVW